MRISVSTVASSLLVIGVVVVLAVSDARMFEDAEITPLYEATLQSAYNRFEKSDERVPARPLDAMEIDFANEQPQPAGQPVRPRGTRSGRQPRRPPPGRSRTAPPAGNRPAAGAGQRPPPQAMGAGGAAPAQVAYHDHNGPHMTQGNQYARQKEYDKAAAEFRLELQEHPQCALAHHRLADVLRHQGKFDEAVSEYRETLKCHESYYCVYTHMGDILLSQNRPGEAEKMFDKAIEGYRKQIAEGGAQASVSRYHLAKLFVDRRRNLDEAVKLAQEAVAQDPDQSVYLHLLAQCYQALGRTQEAIAAIDKAIKLDPDRTRMYQAFRNRLGGGRTPPAGPAADDSSK